MRTKIKKYEDMQPSVEIMPKYEKSEAWLTLKNSGEHQAVFSVNVLRLETEWLILPTNQRLPMLPAKWRFKHDSPEKELMSGSSGEIAIAKTEGRILGDEKHPNGLEGLSIFSAYETFSAKVSPMATIELDIEVFTEPKLKRPHRQTYVMHFNEEGYWDKFEEK